jgi:hypothetical protein
MRHRWQRGFALFNALAVLGLTGVPLASIQLWGWGTMFARYVEIMPVSDALEYTLSGQEMCGYCAFVARSTEPEQTQLTLHILQELRLLMVPAEEAFGGLRPQELPLSRIHFLPPEQLTEEPRDPPPRAFGLA